MSPGDAPSWSEVVLVALNVAQTVALAYMAQRSQRVRRDDRRGQETPD